jgi:hypothetical protein
MLVYESVDHRQVHTTASAFTNNHLDTFDEMYSINLPICGFESDFSQSPLTHLCFPNSLTFSPRYSALVVLPQLGLLRLARSPRLDLRRPSLLVLPSK